MKKKARAEEEYHRATPEPVYDEYVGCGDEIEPDLITGIRASLEHQYIYEETIRHRQPDSQWERGSGSGPMPQGIQRSASMRQPTAPPQLSRIGSMRQSGIRGFMRGLGRRSALDIIDIDPQAYPSQITKQTRIDDAYTKEKKRDIGKAIAKWFNFHKIPANTAQGPYYQSMISSIQKSGTGIQPPTPKEIHGIYLDEEVAELKDWIKSFKRQWDEYGVTLMCDSWIGSTRMSIINFFIYCNRRVVFHKSVNVSDKIQDANYIENIIDTVVEEIGSQYIVQIVTNNEANFKKAGLQLMKKRKTLFWTPCATHCMDLMLKDISELPSVNKCITRAQSITKFIYNNHWIHSLMQKYINGEILRPGVTRFATNFIILKSIQQKKQDGEFEKEALGEFVKSNSLPLVITFTQDKAPMIFGGDMTEHVLAFVDTTKDYVSGIEAALKVPAKANKGKLLHVIMPSTEKRIVDYFGLKDEEMPAVMLVNMAGSMKKYGFDYKADDFVAKVEDGLAEDLVAFEKSYFEGNLTPLLKSADPEYDSDEAVKVIVGTEFQERVIDNEKDVLLEFYAPWCGHCKALAPKYEELAEKFADVDSIMIAKMDATANEIDHPGVDVRGFPTLLFFPAKDKQNPIVYEGSRDVEGFTEFLKTNAQKFELDGSEHGAEKQEAADEDEDEEDAKEEKKEGAEHEEL